MPDEAMTSPPPDAPRPILQIINSPDPGGVLALADSIAEGLAPRGFAVETLFLTPQPDMSPWAKIKGALRAGQVIIQRRHRGVIAYQAWPSIVVGLAGLVSRRRDLVVHQTTVPSATKAPLRYLSRLLGTVGLYPVNIVNTGFTQSLFDHYSPAYRRHLRLIEHGVPRPRVRRSRAETLQRHGIPATGRILLNTARLVLEKNQDTIIRALPSLPDCQLVVAGDGASRAEFQALADQLEVADRVHLLGALPHQDAIDLYGAADVFVFPSEHETFGISAVEAALLALPTLAADISVLREVLTIDGRSTARFVGPRDVEGWVMALREWGESPPPLAERQAFADRLAERYSERRMIDAYAELLSQPRR